MNSGGAQAMARKARMHVQHPRRKPSQGSPQREKRHPSDARQEGAEEGHGKRHQETTRTEMRTPMEYPARFTLDKEVGGYVVTFPDVPEAITQGDTIEEAMAMASEALTLALTFYTEKWADLPVPGSLKRGMRMVRGAA